MSDSAGHERFGDDVAAYLLGAHDPQERAEFERHLASCHICQDELERLGVAAEALPRSVQQFDPPPSLKRSIMREISADAPQSARPARSMWWRRPGRIAIALACVIAAVVVGEAIHGSPSPAPSARTVTATVDHSRVGTAHATVVVSGSGGQVHVSSMPQPARGRIYQIWVKRGSAVQPAALFGVDQNGNGSGALPQNLRGVTQIFVTRERRGGAHQPTEAPVISASI